jgi:hypothetical protein
MVGQTQETKTVEDIILEEGFGLGSILQGIQELATDAQDAIFPIDTSVERTGSLNSLNDDNLSVTSTACSLTDASTATSSRSIRKSVSWFDDEINNCSVEIEYAGMKKKSGMKDVLAFNKKLSLNIMPSGKRTSRKSKKAANY